MSRNSSPRPRDRTARRRGEVVYLACFASKPKEDRSLTLSRLLPARLVLAFGEGAVSVRQRRGRSGLTPSSVFHRVPTAPSTELPRLMASQVAVASANVSSVVGRGRNRLGAFLRLSRRARTRVSRRSRGRCSRGAEPGPVPRDLAVCAAPTRRASRCRRSRPP